MEVLNQMSILQLATFIVLVAGLIFTVVTAWAFTLMSDSHLIFIEAVKRLYHRTSLRLNGLISN